MNMLKPNSPDPVASSSSTEAPKAADVVPEPTRVANPTDPDVVVAARQKADDLFRNRRGRDRTRLTDSNGGGAGSSVPYSRTTLG